MIAISIVAFFVGIFISSYAAERGIKKAIGDLSHQSDQLETAARQTRQDVAGIVWMLAITNGFLAAILVALIVR